MESDKAKQEEISQIEGKINNILQESTHEHIIKSENSPDLRIADPISHHRIFTTKNPLEVYLQKVSSLKNINTKVQKLIIADTKELHPASYCNSKMTLILKYVHQNSVENLQIESPREKWVLPNKALPSLCSILNKNTQIVFLYSLEISKKQLQRIISNSTRCLRVTFGNCKLEIKDLKFSTGFIAELTFLSFIGCALVKHSDWQNHPEHIYHLLKAISSSRLKNTLKKLDLYPLKLNLQDMESWIKELNLEKLQIIYKPKTK
ncbi:unnamed protein product [Moneuplotes crassus]|uniref:Uncharacterized protein n=1 Tax=Euplotes crassus TaxID=5936 RepID=A0AAD1XLD6_EUPCR|nr:unnamed protein product [Moneuplotes crassus]